MKIRIDGDRRFGMYNEAPGLRLGPQGEGDVEAPVFRLI